MEGFQCQFLTKREYHFVLTLLFSSCPILNVCHHSIIKKNFLHKCKSIIFFLNNKISLLPIHIQNKILIVLYTTQLSTKKKD